MALGAAWPAVLVENRTGAASNIAAEAVIKARADGYTILMCGMTNAINDTLYDKLNFTFHRDIAPVAGVMRAPQVIDVNSSSPVKTLPDFIAYAKANPGKLIMGSGGIGTLATRRRRAVSDDDRH
jgi:tripartite-type tricarboxylate transporter receptor subunit TctC